MDFIRPGIHIEFMKYNRITVSISVVFMVICLISIFFINGLNYGIDFSGGTEIQVAFSKTVETDDVRAALEPLGFVGATIQSMGISSENEFLIRTSTEGDAGYEAAKKIEGALKSTFGAKDVDIRGTNMVGSAVSEDLKRKGFFSLLYAGLGLLIYIWWRFELSFSLGAIAALIHDVIITVGMFSLTGKEIDLTVIAALLTIVGFSLNDTIVIFDRVRENLKKMTGSVGLAAIMDSSVSQTLNRTMLTSLTVFVTILCLFLIGGSVIHNFAFAMIVGVLSGVYSTVFVANPVVLYFSRNKK